ncbi:glycosyltransferase [Nitrosomonas sp. Nm33]|uniref:glycosyltransferase n=1 Tax=Nitrosomonas sp. Nm33 TaxID=133724 RepID=UPI0008944029|nr:glycosyltransferase [Nitrosomonas sp. Nm33]SDY85887.1 Glycosyltransferase, GT2 family [Nitrosomonas sp. Nm33]
MTGKKQLLLIDPTGNRNLSEEERALLPSGQWQLVTASANNPEAITQSRAVLVRAGLGGDLCKVLEVVNGKLTPGSCLIIATQPDQEELARLEKLARNLGLEITQRSTQSGQILLRFDSRPIRPDQFTAAINRPTQVLTPVQQDFLGLVFDEAWYLSRHPVVTHLIKQGLYANAEAYFVAESANAGHSPGPLVDVPLCDKQGVPVTFLYYLTNSASVSPCSMFDESYYRNRYPDIAAGIQQGKFVSGYHHFLKSGYREDRRPHPFLLPFSTRIKFGLTASDIPLQDWLAILEGRTEAGVLFDVDWYRAVYQSELIRHDLLPHRHFAQRNLCGKAASLPDFDMEYYRNAYPDLEDVDDLFLHYLYKGIQEERRPNDYFDPQYYLSNHPEVAREIAELGLLGSFEHFQLIGAKRGLRAHLPLAQILVPEREGKAIFERQAELIAANVRMGYKIRLPQVAQPKVSIIIPVVDNFAFTLQLLKQLSHILDADTEVIVVDAASKDETRKLEAYVDNVNVIHLDKRASFSANCNLGALLAGGETLVFMNNDITLEPDALGNAMSRLHSAPDIACVGGRVMRSHGLVQEAGNVIWSDGSTNGVGRDNQANAHNLLTVRDVDMCSACFIAVKRDVFGKIGCYDEAFDPGYCEDADLALRFWKAGYRVVYDPTVVVHHYEYGSYSKGRPPSTSAALILAHQQILRHKHADILKQQPVPGTLSVLFAADRRYRQGNTILFIEDRPPEKHLGSGYVRSVDIIQGLRAMGHNVVVWARKRGHNQHACYPDLAGVDVVHADEHVSSLSQFLQANHMLFQTLWVCRTHNFSFYYPDLMAWKAAHPGGQLIADTEALTAIREIEQMRVFGLDPASAQGKLKQEIASLELADRVLTVSQAEQSLIQQQLPDKDCRLLAHQADWPRQHPVRKVRKAFEGRKSFGFLGAVHGFESPNLDSIIWLCNECFPRIRQRLPDVTLRIAGYWDERVPHGLVQFTDGIEWLGAVDDLDDFFSQIRVFLAPTRFAAGLPQKIASAVAHGVPCVVSPLLQRQIGWDEQVGYLAPANLTPDEYAECAVQLYNDARQWTRIREAGLLAVERDFGERAFVRMLERAVASPL